MKTENQKTSSKPATQALSDPAGSVPSNLERLTKAKELLEAAAAEIHAVHATGQIDLKRTSVLASAFCRAHDAKEDLMKTFLSPNSATSLSPEDKQ